MQDFGMSLVFFLNALREGLKKQATYPLLVNKGVAGSSKVDNRWGSWVEGGSLRLDKKMLNVNLI